MSDAWPAGKRFLITHTLIHNVMGSTVMVLELADHLRSQGADVEVWTNFTGPPAIDWFRQRGIPVTVDEDADLRLSDYDVVWVNSQVLPLAFITQLRQSPVADAPAFVFNHMSALEYAPDEHPHIPGLEERLASLVVFVASETRRKLLPFLETAPPATGLYPNPAPLDFCRLDRTHRKRPRRFLIVSNHRCPEVEEAKALLRQRGNEVIGIGAGHDEYRLVTPEDLERADVVVTIGKTVQYALVSATPVFVYDHFGGYGYLSPDNLPLAQSRNFSGRGGQRMTADAIVDRLFAGYRDAVTFQVARREEFVQDYSIESVVHGLLAGLAPRQIEPFPDSYANVVASAMRFSRRFYRNWGRLDDAHARLREKDQRIHDLQNQVDEIITSRSFRLGYSILRPVMPIYHRLDRRGRHAE